MEFVLKPVGVPPVRNLDWVWWDNYFTDQELDILQNLAKESKEIARIQSNNIPQLDIRRTRLNWVSNTEKTSWVFEKLGSLVSRVNAEFFRFDLTGFAEPIQLTNYMGTEEGTYDWHMDSSPAINRKLSLVVQLTNPEDYEGGDLQILNGGHPVTVKKKRGFIAFFPSFFLHKVTPVTRGERQSLVLWITGPDFR